MLQFFFHLFQIGVQTWQPLDLNFRTYQTNGVKFVIPGLTKSRQRGPLIEAFYPKSTNDHKLCLLLALQAYEERMKGHRKILIHATHFYFH